MVDYTAYNVALCQAFRDGFNPEFGNRLTPGGIEVAAEEAVEAELSAGAESAIGYSSSSAAAAKSVRFNDVVEYFGDELAPSISSEASELSALSVAEVAAITTETMAGVLALAAITIIATLLPIILAFRSAKPARYRTGIRITTGGIGYDAKHNVTVDDVNQGGSVPHLKVWNEAGQMVGQWDKGKNKHLAVGDSIAYEIDHHPDHNAQPTYLSVSMHENDAICISHIQMTWPDGLRYNWIGDIGYACGAKWYYNTIPSNTFGHLPRCTWLDKDHQQSNYAGMGIHMPDFVSSGPRTYYYATTPKALCESPPRFQMYENFGKNDWHVMYNPPVRLNQSTLVDLDPKWTIHNDGTSFGHPHPNFKYMKVIDDWVNKTNTRDPGKKARGGKKRSTQHAVHKKHAKKTAAKSKPAPVKAHYYHTKHYQHLVSSDHERHSAKHLCQSEDSWGPDFISTREEMFCDISTKQLWPLCKGSYKLTEACFDYETKTMVPPSGGFKKRDVKSGRFVPEKKFISEDVWRAGSSMKVIH
ncbi:MAG: hypothetical protein MMC23_002421 [Stictis urceolatum]|nr:hypothetical protein [Stictis urceolata]